MSKGRRLVTAAGIALAALFGVQLGLAQAPAPGSGTGAPATKNGTSKGAPKRPNTDPAPAAGEDPFPPARPTPAADDTASQPVVVPPAGGSAPADESAKAQENAVPADKSNGTPRDRFDFNLSTTPPPKGEKDDDPPPDPRQQIFLPGTRDAQVVRAQAPGGVSSPPAAEAAAPDGAGDGFLLRPESLPVGPHSVGLTVDVQAPAAVNLHRITKLLIVVKNSGNTDALGVVVREPLPDGLEFVESSPSPTSKVPPVLVWNLGTVPAGTEKRIQLQVKATKKVGSIDHAPTVSLLTGGRARMAVREPKLKVEQRSNVTKALKGQQIRYEITVTNTGDGPASNVIIKAELGSGLKHREGNPIELPLKSLDPPRPILKPGDSVELDLVVDTVAGGEQACKITALSNDVVPNTPEAQAITVVAVVEPKLILKVKAPAKRYTGNLATYHLILENPGTAVAKNVRAKAVLPVTGGRVSTPSNAQWYAQDHYLFWNVGDVEAGKTVDLPFSVQLEGSQIYRIDAVAKANNIELQRQSGSTLVSGMADVKFGVREAKRVIDVGEETVFEITVANSGSTEALKLQIKAELSEHLKAMNTSGTEKEAGTTADLRNVIFPQIDRLEPGAEMKLTIQVQGLKPGTATCRVDLMHDDIDGKGIQHTQTVKVTDSNEAAP